MEEIKEKKIKLKDLNHLKEISWYNNNYYIMENKLIYAESDDDNFTQLYEIDLDKLMQKPIGYCYTSENDVIHFDEREIY